MRITIDTKTILIDDEDFCLLPKNGTWFFDKDGYPLYRFFSEEMRKDCSFRLHRWVLSEPIGLLVDHINGNILDARKENLRVATHEENSYNKKKYSKTFKGTIPTSQYKGVCRSASGKWQAQTKHKGKSIHIGTFETEKDAALAYNEAAARLKGRFARLNDVS